MCLIKGAFVGEKNFDVIKMHGTTIKKDFIYLRFSLLPSRQIVPFLESMFFVVAIDCVFWK
jgi:hypothetical protein